MNWDIKTEEAEFRCYICNKTKPKGTLSVRYLQGDLIIRWVCLWHKLCFSYIETGAFCSNHEEGLDVDCNTVPF